MSERVLIIDDSLTVRMDLAEAFESASFAVVLCASAKEARDALRASRPDVIVLDVVLPDGDGVELLREIRASASCAGAAVLMLSTEAEVRDRVRAMQTGADEYVGKPYDRTYVVAKARELLRERGTQTPPAASVLVIDDSATFRERLRETLEAAGYVVTTASTGEEGLQTAASIRPNAIIVDGELPGIDGPTVIRRIRLDGALRGTPCLLLTAAQETDVELRALDAGADAFVRKDEELGLVLARLAAAMRDTDGDEQPTPSLLGPRKVLAVDDDPGYVQALASALRDEGLDVAIARSGEEALEVLAVQTMDCVLIDDDMPGLGGLETCRSIKAASFARDLPVIVLTSGDERAAIVEGIAAGADDCVSRTTELSVLKAHVRAQIRRKQLHDENRRIREQRLRSEFEAAEARAARELAEARAALAEELQRKNQELEAFTSSVSHDLRAPLRSIDSFTRMLEEDYNERLDDTGRGYIKRVRTATKRMSEIIEDLLKLARVSAVELRRQPVDVSAEARSILGQLRDRDPSRAVETRVADGLAVDADRGLFRTMLENLLSNAWKYTARTERAVIEVGAADHAGERVLFVRDNGAGFDPAQADKLFRPFQRLHAASEFEGTGIGLATVYRIVTRHGGRVWAEGAVGAGATVYFRI